MFLVCAVALHTAGVSGAVAFADPRVAAALSFAWPAAIANWIARLASETRWRVFDNVAVAVARKETTAMRRATRARRLGGLPAPKLPPPDAKRWRRIRYALALVAGQWREAATCGSARAFRRVIAACCVLDWLAIASVWSGLGVVAAVADGTLAHVSNVSASTLAPTATFLFLDATRVAAQLVHARLLVGARVSSDVRRSPPGTDGLGEMDAARAPSRWFSFEWTFGAFGRALPAGMVARLTRTTYALNVWNLALVVVAGVFLGGVSGSSAGPGMHPAAASTALAASSASASSFLIVVRFVVVARFTRLVAETAYLAAALLAVVDRPRIVAEGTGDAGIPMTSLRLDLRDLGVDGNLSSAVAERIAAARALAARLGAGFANTGAFVGTSSAFGPTASPDASPSDRSAAFAATPAMTLAEFTEAIAPGLRGYLVGARAEAAAAKVFREISASAGSSGPGDAAGSVPGDSVGLTDIQRWLAAQPSLRGPDATGPTAATASDAVSDVEKEIQWRRSVQRVLLRLARRAEYGRRQHGRGEGATAVDAASASAPHGTDERVDPAADASASDSAPAPAKPRGLRLLSLEGGGIKGLALIWQLRALERAAGRPIHELFDLIGGVSTGGIIALGLARGVPLRELEKMYHDIGRDVFGSQSAVRRLLKGNAADNTAIRDLLLEYLGDLPMLDAPGQLARCFVVATQQTERLEVRLVRTYRHPNKGRDQNEGWRQWEAGMATSSAPTVFPPFVRDTAHVEASPAARASELPSSETPPTSARDAEKETETEASETETERDAAATEGPSTAARPAAKRAPRSSANLLSRAARVGSSPPRQVFIDGALSGYNNPSSLVLNEGLDLAEPGQQIDVLLSLGCGEVAGAAGGESENGDRGLVFWLGQVVNLAFDVELQEAHVASLIQRFSPQTMHVRLNPPTGGVSLTEHRPEILHRMEQDTRQYLAENRVVFADVAAALVENSGFARVDAAPSTPWDAPGLEDAFWDAPSAGDDARAGAAALGTSAARASVDAERRASHAAGANGVFSVSDADAAGGGSGLPAGTFESFARERDRERVTRRDAKGASVTVRRGSGAFGGDAARRRKKITASAPVAPLDRFPSFPGPGTARSAEAARRRADAARAFADTSNERTGWRRLFWGAGVKAARGAVDEDVGEVAEVQPLREQVALGEVPDVDTSSRRSRRRDSRETTKTRVRGETTSRGAREGAAVGAASARAAGESASPPGARPVSAKSWLDEGAESVSGWDDDASFATGDAEEAKASKGAEEANEARARPTARAPSATPSADAESASDAR